MRQNVSVQDVHERGTPLVNGGKTSKCLVTPLSGLLATESVSGVTDDGDGDEVGTRGRQSMGLWQRLAKRRRRGSAGRAHRLVRAIGAHRG